METKGSFLKSKMHNMRAWLQGELTGAAVHALPEVTEVQACYLEECLIPHKGSVSEKRFEALAADKSLDASFREVLTEIQRAPATHDKFWRYVDLFLEVAEQ